MARVSSGTTDIHQGHALSSVPAAGPPPAPVGLDVVQQRLHALAVQQLEEQAALHELTVTALQLTNGNRVAYFEQMDGDHVEVAAQVTTEGETAEDSVDRQLHRLAAAAGCQHSPQFARCGGRTLVAVPVIMDDRCDALGAVLTVRRGEVEPLVVCLQMVAGYATLWWQRQDMRQLDWETRMSCGLIEIIGDIHDSGEPARACVVTANKLRELLSCSQVAIGLRRGRSSRVALQTISSRAEFDSRGEISRIVESAMGEAQLRGELTMWPPTTPSQRAGTLAHKELAERTAHGLVMGVPLTAAQEEFVGVVTLMWKQTVDVAPVTAFATTSAPLLAGALQKTRQLQGGPLRKLAARISGRQSWSGAKQLLAACLLAAAVLSVPVQHKVACRAVIEPKSRRFVVAPHAGVLKETFAKPGDVVPENQLLATMDDRELHWELAGLTADRDRAAKKRDSNLSHKQVAEMQMAALEVERLELQIRRLQHRQQNLEIRSAVAGVVLRGDLDGVRGAPVESGQALFEIAPLAGLRLDIAIPEQDVTFVHEEMKVELRLEAFPDRLLSGRILRLHPQAEVTDSRNVFPAEVELGDVDDALRPGMKGEAKVIGARRSLGWILFHRPWYRLINFLR